MVTNQGCFFFYSTKSGTVESEYSLDAKKQSNNSAELSAIGEALIHFRDLPASSLPDTNTDHLEIYSDSEYAINLVFTQTAPIPVENGDLVRKIRKIVESITAIGKTYTIHKVQAHTGDRWNERADQLADQGASTLSPTGRFGPPLLFTKVTDVASNLKGLHNIISGRRPTEAEVAAPATAVVADPVRVPTRPLSPPPSPGAEVVARAATDAAVSARVTQQGAQSVTAPNHPPAAAPTAGSHSSSVEGQYFVPSPVNTSTSEEDVNQAQMHPARESRAEDPPVSPTSAPVVACSPPACFVSPPPPCRSRLSG